MSPDMGDPGSIYVPVRFSSDVIELRKDSLPADADDVLDIFRAEAAPLSLWLEVAKAYLDRGDQAAFEKVLRAGVSEETQTGFVKEGIDVQKERLQCLCALGAFYTQLGQAGADDRRSQASCYLQANSLFNAAFRLGREVLPSLGQGQLALARVRADLQSACSAAGVCVKYSMRMSQGELADAHKHFTTAAECVSRGRPSIAGTLALAALHCRKEEYREAVQL